MCYMCETKVISITNIKMSLYITYHIFYAFRIVRAFLIEEQKIVKKMLATKKKGTKAE